MSPLLIPLFAALGLAAGLVHFVAIDREAVSLVGRGDLWHLIGLRLGRLLVTVAVLLFASRHGWPSLLAATLGFMAGRQIVMRRMGSLP